MKRLRDDVYSNSNSQFRRPFVSPLGEPYGQPQVPGDEGVGDVAGGTGGGGGGGTGGGGSSEQKLTTNDALTYLKDVKVMFHDQREKYDMFLEVMKDFRAQRLDTAGVIARVKELFKGYNNLILGFNTFLPKGYEITVDEPPLKRAVEFQEAISFVTKIKNRFENDDRVYKTFLDILNMYRNEHKSIKEVYHEVTSLFKDQRDLLDEFKFFLPDNSPHLRNSNNRVDEKSSAMVPVKQTQIDIPVKQTQIDIPVKQTQIDKHRNRQDRIITPYADRDPPVEIRDTEEADKAMTKLNKDQIKKSEKEIKDGKNSDQERKDSDQDRKKSDQDSKKSEKEIKDRKNSDQDRKKSDQDSKEQDLDITNKDINRIEKRKSEDIGVNSGSVPIGDKDAVKSMYKEEFTFCKKVQDRLRNEDDYQAFLKCVHIYNTEIITKKELQSLVSDLLGKHPDLMEGFSAFLGCENIDGVLAGLMDKKSLWSEGHASKSTRTTEDKEREQNAAKEDKFKEKYWAKSIQELDLSDCQRCTPSYRLLPDDYPIPSVSQRSELGTQVLNDLWVSVTSGSEDYSFKHMRRNQYEESLFRCEDDRFELDMLLESVNSTAKRAEEFLNKIKNSPETPIRIEDHFTALNLRCMERLYGDHGLDAMETLRRNPSVSLPVMINRLKQKKDEWTKCRSDFNKVWREVYAKNHYKSLDHRSFYFKQQDSKDLSTKSLVAEIKEIKGKSQTDKDILLTIAAGNRHSIMPNLEYEYTDKDVHEDASILIKFSCNEICNSKEQLNKVLNLWTTFFEPILLCVPPSQPSADERKGVLVNGDGVRQEKEGREATTRSNNATENGHTVKSNIDGVTGSQHHSDTIRSITKPNGHSTPINPSKPEKEEGELSPTHDSQDYATLNNNNTEADSEDDEISASESTGPDDCSREEQEEEEEEDGKPESEGEGQEGNGIEDSVELPASECFSRTVKPLAKCVASSSSSSSSSPSSSCRVFYGNDAFYTLFRLHQALYDRLLSAKTNLIFAEGRRKTAKDPPPSDLYPIFMTSLYKLLNGAIDNAKFEDDCRAIYGNQSYILFTLDKLILKIVKQLQSVVGDEIDNKLLQLYEYEKFRKPEKFIDSVYYENAHVVLHDENIFRFQSSSCPSRLTIQLMDDGIEKSEVVPVSLDSNFASYLHKDFLSVDKAKKQSGLMMKRNKRRFLNMDESSAVSAAMEGAHVVNGLEYKMSCSSSKISYVLDTEDGFFRERRKRRKRPSSSSLSTTLTSSSCCHNSRTSVERFHRFLETSLSKPEV